MEKIVLIGGGGHSRVVVDLIKLIGQYEIIGICDSHPGNVQGIPVIGTEECLLELFLSGVKNAFISFGAIGNANKRRSLGERLLKQGFTLPNLIHPTAYVAPTVKMGMGNFIGINVILNTNSALMDGCIINSASIIEHDVKIGHYAHVAPGAVVCGGALISDLAHIGPNAIILQCCQVATGVMVGAGSVVTKNIDVPNITGYGNPFKEVRSHG